MYLKHYETFPETVIFGEEGKFLISFQIEERHPFLHLKFANVKAGKDSLKNITYAVENLTNFLGAVGYPIVFAVVPKDKKSLHRLYSKLGFQELTEWDDNLIYSIDTPNRHMEEYE